MKLSIKLYLLILVAVIIGILFFLSMEVTNRTLRSNSQILSQLNHLQELQRRLDKETLISAYLIYHNYDEMELITRESEATIRHLQQSSLYQSKKYHEVRTLLDNYIQKLKEKKHNIHRFQTLNSIIKNSATHIPALGNRFFQSQTSVTQYNYYTELLNIITTIFLSKHSLDPDFLFDIDGSMEQLDGLAINDEEIATFNQMFRAHVFVFKDNFPQYTAYLSDILQTDTNRSLEKISAKFSHISHQEIDLIENLTLALSIAFGLSFLYIAWMLISSHRAHQKLELLQSRLFQEAYHDRLTGLGNRLAFNRNTDSLDSPTLILFDIDGFKQINDFYGNNVGDEILRYVGQSIQALASTFAGQVSVYRLSSDEFAVRLSTTSNDKAYDLASNIVYSLEAKSYDYKGFEIPVSLSASISSLEPLLEKADLTLKHVKDNHLKILNYSPELMLEQLIENNLITTGIIRHAIDNDGIQPWFQPILDNNTGTISHYECLVRIYTEKGDLLQPQQFMSIAKVGHLYSQITCILMEKCFEEFQSRDIGFSLNISAKDTQNIEITECFFNLLDAHPETGKRLAIELLETEGIDDYGQIQKFISKARRYGCKIAIDDFGAGYSSLEHVLKLSPDYVKLDGSLIENIDIDVMVNTLVRAIVSTLGQIGITDTVAEYVHTQAIQDIIHEIGITHSQGYHIGKPSEHLKK